MGALAVAATSARRAGMFLAMMILRSSPTSPFGRKIKIAAELLGLSGEIELMPADTMNPDAPLLRQNPLGKIPTLILASDETLFDSSVILEYLDALAGGGKIIPTGEGRFRVLTRQALADGLMDAALLQVYEQRMREPAERGAKWVDLQAGKVARALAAFEADPPGSGDRDVAAITLACALGYLDLRFAGAWRGGHPSLVAWLEEFSAAVPAFEATRFRG
jgi:glutathione S-transferase